MLHRFSIAYRSRHLGHDTHHTQSGTILAYLYYIMSSLRHCDHSHRWPRWPRCNCLAAGVFLFFSITMGELAIVTIIAAAKTEISARSLLRHIRQQLAKHAADSCRFYKRWKHFLAQDSLKNM